MGLERQQGLMGRLAGFGGINQQFGRNVLKARPEEAPLEDNHGMFESGSRFGQFFEYSKGCCALVGGNLQDARDTEFLPQCGVRCPVRRAFHMEVAFNCIHQPGDFVVLAAREDGRVLLGQQCLLHRIVGVDVGDFEFQCSLAGKAHRQQRKAIAGEQHHGLIDAESEVVGDSVFGRLKIELSERIIDLRQDFVDVAQNVVVTLVEDFRNMQGGGDDFIVDDGQVGNQGLRGFLGHDGLHLVSQVDAHQVMGVRSLRPQVDGGLISPKGVVFATLPTWMGFAAKSLIFSETPKLGAPYRHKKTAICRGGEPPLAGVSQAPGDKSTPIAWLGSTLVLLCLHLSISMLANASNDKKGASMKKDESKVIGALARAEQLPPERRSEIAKEAARARWNKRITHEGTLRLVDIEIPCYVTEDGVRVLSGRGMQEALRLVDEEPSKRGAKPWSRVDRFFSTKPLKSLISNDGDPDRFAAIKCHYNGTMINGYRAEVLPEICEAMLDARDNNALDTERKKIIAKQCDLLMRGFARVGIVALIDEATGYQEVRDRQALQAILDRYLAKQFAAWAKRFPDEFYQQMFRLKGWTFNPLSVARPGVVGRYTVDLVYERLVYGLVEELEKLNPKKETGRRKSKHHQWLSDDVGHPALAQHLHAVIGLMRASSGWEQFTDLLDRAFPKRGHTIPMLLD